MSRKQEISTQPNQYCEKSTLKLQDKPSSGSGAAPCRSSVRADLGRVSRSHTDEELVKQCSRKAQGRESIVHVLNPRGSSTKEFQSQILETSLPAPRSMLFLDYYLPF